MRAAARVRSYAVPALEKGLDLLEALASRPTPPSQTDLARALGRSPSEIFRMLDCLERRGYIAKDGASGRYRLTLRLYQLAHTHTPVDHLLRAAAQPMRDLAHELHESCHLSVLAEGRLIVLAQVESPDRIRISVETGGSFPATLTASGRLLLAHLEPEELQQLLARDEDYARMSAAERKKLLARLLEVRRSGIYSGMSELTRGVRDVVARVGNPRIGVTAALCVPSITVRGRRRPAADLRGAVERAADRITEQLGLTPS